MERVVDIYIVIVQYSLANVLQSTVFAFHVIVFNKACFFNLNYKNTLIKGGYLDSVQYINIYQVQVVQEADPLKKG